MKDDRTKKGEILLDAFGEIKDEFIVEAADSLESMQHDDADKVMADINDPVQEAPAVSDAVEDNADHIEEVLDTESFDELCEKAMNGFNEDEADDVPLPTGELAGSGCRRFSCLRARSRQPAALDQCSVLASGGTKRWLYAHKLCTGNVGRID